MSIRQYFEKLDTSEIFHRVPIIESWVKRACGAANALYEALWDECCPGGASKLWCGHDHSTHGGLVLAMNSQLTSDDGDEPIASKTSIPSTSGGGNYSINIGKFYTTTGLETSELSTFLEIAICIKCVNANFYIWSGDGGDRQQKAITEGAVGSSESSGDVRWTIIKRPIASSGWVDLVLQVERADSQSQNDDLAFYIYSINVAETAEWSQKKIGARELESFIVDDDSVASSNFLTLSYFDKLQDELSEILEFLDAWLLKTIYSAINSLFEGTLNKAAPGRKPSSYTAGSFNPYICGHNHQRSISPTGLGGRPIPRGKIFSVGKGKGVGSDPAPANVHWYSVVCTLQSTYYELDASRMTGLGALFYAYVDSGLDSSGDPPANPPYLEAYIYCDGGFYVKIENKTAAAFSEVKSTTAGWNKISKIPCVGESWNRFWFWVQHPSAPAQTFNIDSICLVETVDKTYYPSTGMILGKEMGGTERVRV